MIYNIEFGGGEKVLSYSREALNTGDIVIFKTSNGEEIGKIVSSLKESEEGEAGNKTSANIVRKATQQEYEDSKKANVEFLKTCVDKVRELNLQIKIVSARIQFDRSELYMDVLPEKKGSVKTLLKEISKVYKEKIIIHQVGRRDLTRRFKTYGVCGKMLCCASFLTEFEPINVDLMKSQNLSCGTTKLTGLCGKLMCCLAFEKENYKNVKSSESSE